MTKVLLWDIETLPHKGYFWGLFDQNISEEFVIKHSSICNIAYKWLGEEEVYNLSVADNKARYKKDPYDDRQIISKFIKILNSADIVIAHNGDKFDYPRLKAKAIEYRLPDFNISKIDTLKMAREHKFMCGNKLGALAKKLGVARKGFSSAKWWFNMAERSCSQSAKLMAEYGKQDVLVLEDIYLILEKYSSKKIVNRHLNDKAPKCCAGCGSTHYKKNGTAYTATYRYQRYKCLTCLHMFKGERL